MTVSSLLPQHQSMEGSLLQTAAQAELLATCLEDWMATCNGVGGAPCRCVGTSVAVGVEQDGGGPFGLARCRHVMHACDMVSMVVISSFLRGAWMWFWRWRTFGLMPCPTLSRGQQ
jgi:hypothetical protein